MNHFLRLLPLLALTSLLSCSENSVEPTTRRNTVDSLATEIFDGNESKGDSTDAGSVNTHAEPYPDSVYYRYGANASLPYRFIVPRRYASDRKYPLVIFLHGIGERGTDNESQLRWGSTLFTSDKTGASNPAFIVFPQCPAGAMWTTPQVSSSLMELIHRMNTQYQIDLNRVYIVGMSMGAYGTYQIVADHPGVFAAAIAISGDSDIRKINNMAKTDWRIFAGGKDEVVNSSHSIRIFEALEQAGAHVEIKLYPEADHMGSWTKAFAEPDFCSWLFSKKKGG